MSNLNVAAQSSTPSALGTTLTVGSITSNWSDLAIQNRHQRLYS